MSSTGRLVERSVIAGIDGFLLRAHALSLDALSSRDWPGKSFRPKSVCCRKDPDLRFAHPALNLREARNGFWRVAQNENCGTNLRRGDRVSECRSGARADFSWLRKRMVKVLPRPGALSTESKAPLSSR